MASSWILNHTVCKLVNFIAITMSTEIAFHKFSLLAMLVRVHKWNCKYMSAWHIYSYTWQSTPLFNCPSCPEWPKRGVKPCLATFKCLLITEWGDGKFPAVGLGQNKVHHINQRRNSFLSHPPANTYMQLWICEMKKKGSCCFIIAIMYERVILTLDQMTTMMFGLLVAHQHTQNG